MVLLWILVCMMVGGGASAAWGADLAGADSWLLMVEAGRDGPGRRITPKSVFIAPAIVPRAERCRPGFRYDHLGRCVKVIRVDPQAQLELLLKRLQGSQTMRPPSPLPSPPSAGPLHFSLSLGGLEDPQPKPDDTTTSPLTTLASSTKLSSMPFLPPFTQEQWNTDERPTQSPSTSPSETTFSSTTKISSEKTVSSITTHSTTETTVETRETHAKDISTTTEPLPEVASTLREEAMQTTTFSSTPYNEDFTKLEGSGSFGTSDSDSVQSTSATTFEGSGSSTINMDTTELSSLPTLKVAYEGSGSEPETESTVNAYSTLEVPEDREERSTTISSDEQSTTFSLENTTLQPTNCCADAPIPPNEKTAALLLAILKGVAAEKENEAHRVADEHKLKEPILPINMPNYEDVVSATKIHKYPEGKNEQLPIVEYIDLVLPSKEIVDESGSKEETDRVLIPLDNIKFNISGKGNDVVPAVGDSKKPEVQLLPAPLPVLPPTPPPLPVKERPPPKVAQFSSHILYPPPPWPKWLSNPEIKSEVTGSTFADPQDDDRGHEANSHDKVFDNFWTENLPLDPAWVRFPEEKPPQLYRKGPLPGVGDHQYPAHAQVPQVSRFRFPEEVVEPENRPVILKFWSRIPMIQGESATHRQYQSDEEQWTGP